MLAIFSAGRSAPWINVHNSCRKSCSKDIALSFSPFSLSLPLPPSFFSCSRKTLDSQWQVFGLVHCTISSNQMHNLNYFFNDHISKEKENMSKSVFPFPKSEHYSKSAKKFYYQQIFSFYSCLLKILASINLIETKQITSFLSQKIMIQLLSYW